ncbi:hypothetical protein ILUMI_23902 [Ignelater luminosus]|uniref:Nucleotide exchange factor Fes1 domain-containing protein n=1 Tax=Ignelater luminosus TaxID=2038154 RepID=A0A8K0FZ93_IGNLU|nr:hypothetical protein ILUMI_23902 [Ignelater luminosus]
MAESNSVESNIEIAGAITYPTESQQNLENVEVPVQPKQPTSLHGLLRFAMDATKVEDAPHDSHMGPIDENRKRFLEAALNSMTVDIIEILQEKIRVLQNAEHLAPDTDISDYVAALETIVDHIDNIDTANDFHKIGGFTIFHPCLKCVHPEIRAGACDVIAELCQNNPYCQRVVLDNGFIPLLLKILATDNNNSVCIKALYATSCIVRQNTEGFHQLLQHEGLTILLKILQKEDDKLKIKTAFLLSSLCGSQPDLKSRLVFLEYIPVLLSLLSQERKPSHEHILSLLVMLVEDNYGAINECRNPKYNLKQTLTDYLESIANKVECQEEEAYCQQLLRILFTSSSNGL